MSFPVLFRKRRKIMLSSEELEKIVEQLQKTKDYSKEKVISIRQAHLLTDKELYKNLFNIRKKHNNYGSLIEIHNQNDTYYLSCQYNQGGYAIKVLCFDDVPYYYHSSNYLRNFDWYYQATLKNKIFGISEIVNINKDIIKLIRLQVFK
jgi:hypothetical protein